ncbi:unnamed protein product [Microthlaspi erraticum]|uniref:Uncharacterized protein n=1 Tax=Microthlaspi erraticum TaxID=1685480 RepID=A0A6D2KBT2_9BRAS|nr:unnamed protein product [Microthlaspi erraticum]
MNHTCIIASSKAKSYESEVFYADSIMRSRFVHSYEISDKVLVNTLKIVCCIVSMPTRQHEVSFQDGISFTAAPMFYISRVPSLFSRHVLLPNMKKLAWIRQPEKKDIKERIVVHATPHKTEGNILI